MSTAHRIQRIIVIQTIAILFLIAGSGYLWYSASRDDANRTAAAKANELEQERKDREEVEGCYRRIGTSRQTIELLGGLEVVLENQVAGTRATLKANPFDPANEQRRRILRRALPALRSTRDFIAQVKAGVPTREECATLQCSLEQRRTGDPPTGRCVQLIRDNEKR